MFPCEKSHKLGDLVYYTLNGPLEVKVIIVKQHVDAYCDITCMHVVPRCNGMFALVYIIGIPYT
jgi:hypothetical protein